MIGQIVSHYKIIEKLGEGGMGVVYKAQDTKLDRLVALKFLPASLSPTEKNKARFISEAKAASALDHHNICTIHEIGETDDGQLFIAMAAYEGMTLSKRIEKGPLKIADALDVAIQIGEGLQAAHEKGIVHRDVKSSNIMLTTKGLVKIMDFGLARRDHADQLTKTGTTLGTVFYMSPEQARGERVDHRSDIWSVGVVLYEMTTGKLPFTSPYGEAVVYEILNETPEPVTGLRTNIPIELERIIGKAMEKDPRSRYQHIEEMLVDLRSVRGTVKNLAPQTAKTLSIPASSRRKITLGLITTSILTLIILGTIYLVKDAGTAIDSIAVLPFINESPDTNLVYLSDGITESLINNLSKLKNLKVMSRASVFRYKQVGADPLSAGKELSVKAVLTGRVLQQASKLWVSAELVDTRTNAQLWGSRYDRNLSGIFALQEDISREIVSKLIPRISGEELARVTRSYTRDTDAYQAYLRGRYHWKKRSEDGFQKAIAYFNQSLEYDPTFALAYGGLADSYLMLGEWGFISAREAFQKTSMYATKALAIDNTLGEVHTSLAWANHVFAWDWNSAEPEFKRALELNPSYATAHQWYAEYLSHMGRLDEAVEHAAKAIQLDPFSLIINLVEGWVRFCARDYDKAIERYLKTIEMEPDFYPAHVYLALAYVYKEMYEKAVLSINEATKLRGPEVLTLSTAAHVYGRAGQTGKAREIIKQMQKSSEKSSGWAYGLALAYVGIGDRDRALEALHKAYDERAPYLASVKVAPWFEELREDQRFKDLLGKMKL